MNQKDLTLGQALKVLISFFVRAWIMMVPLMVVCMIGMFLIFPFPKAGEPPVPPDLKMVPIFFLLWLIAMIGSFVVQAYALRWALKTKWTDFRILIVPVDSEKDDVTK